MYLLRRTLIWLTRFRYRRGYGIHSPFAFNFVTGVVYETGVYYAYERLEQVCGLRSGRLGFSFKKKHIRKCARFLFRLANYVHPDYVLIYGDTEQWEDAYLAAGSVSAQQVKITCSKKDLNTRFAGKTLLVYLTDVGKAEQILASLSGFSTQNTAFVISGIHADTRTLAVWRHFQEHAAAGITFDLYDYGIVFWDRTRFKQHYIVNF